MWMATCSVCCYVLGVFLLFFKIYFMLCVLFLGPGGAFVKQNFTAMVDAWTSIISCLNLNRYCSEISEKHELTYSSVCLVRKVKSKYYDSLYNIWLLICGRWK